MAIIIYVIVNKLPNQYLSCNSTLFLANMKFSTTSLAGLIIKGYVIKRLITKTILINYVNKDFFKLSVINGVFNKSP